MKKFFAATMASVPFLPHAAVQQVKVLHNRKNGPLVLESPFLNVKEGNPSRHRKRKMDEEIKALEQVK